MNKEEIGRLLAIAAAFDQRTTGEVDIDAWHEVIGGMAFDLAKSRLIRWYTLHRERVMPSDILSPAEDDEEIGFWER